MDFEAASESVDGDIHVVWVTGEADLAARDPSSNARSPLDQVLATYPSRAAALNGDGDD